MKRKLLIMEDQRLLMKDIFKISDVEVDQVKIFMECDYKNIADIMKNLIRSDLNEKQKIIVGYIIGSTFGVMQTVVQTGIYGEI